MRAVTPGTAVTFLGGTGHSTLSASPLKFSGRVHEVVSFSVDFAVM